LSGVETLGIVKIHDSELAPRHCQDQRLRLDEALPYLVLHKALERLLLERVLLQCAEGEERIDLALAGEQSETRERVNDIVLGEGLSDIVHVSVVDQLDNLAFNHFAGRLGWTVLV